MKTGKLGIKDKLYVALWEMKLLFKPKKYNAKVFCIGYNKTGTTALGEALRQLGYDHSTFNRKVWRKHYQNGDIESVLSYTAKFESFDDLPWLKEDMIPILDKKFPGSKFIYLDRDEEAWKNSIKQWTKKVSDKDIDPDEKIEGFRSHKKFVLDYFNNRPSDFISLEISDPSGFQKLATFLNKQAPQKHFTTHNKS